MANLTLTGATSGSTTLAPTDGASATLTLPTGTGTVVTTANPISGQVIQTVNTNFQATGASNYFSTSSTSFVTTGIAVSITPKFSTSKILVMATGLLQTNLGATAAYVTIYRNSTNLATGTSPAAMAYVRGGSNSNAATVPTSMIILDAPATTSSTTYTIYAAAESGASCVFGATPGAVNGSQGGITVMEIAA